MSFMGELRRIGREYDRLIGLDVPGEESDGCEHEREEITAFTYDEFSAYSRHLSYFRRH